MLANLGAGGFEAGNLATGIAPQRARNAHRSIEPYQVFDVAESGRLLTLRH